MKRFGKYCKYCGIALGIKNRKGRNLACNLCYNEFYTAVKKYYPDKAVKAGTEVYEQYQRAKDARITMYTKLALAGQPLFKDGDLARDGREG